MGSTPYKNSPKYLFYRPFIRKKPFAIADGFFQLNPPMAEEIHLRWMKSLRDEIPLRGNGGGGFNLSEAARLRFHLGRNAEDFIQTCLDFIVRSTISLKMQGYVLIYDRKYGIKKCPFCVGWETRRVIARSASEATQN